MEQTRLQIWWLAIRPKTLWASVAPVMIGLAMAYADGAFHLPAAVATLLGAILIQIGTNLSNDYSDFARGADTEERQGPLRMTQAGLVSPRAMMQATLFVFFLAAVSSVYLVAVAGWPIAVIGVLAVLSGILYTAGPVPLGYLGLGDLFVLIFFGPVAVGGTYFIQTGDITPSVLLAGLAPGLLSVAILVVNNLRDIEGDTRAGKRTLAVRFGATFVRVEYLLCIVISALIPPVLILMEGWYHASLLASVVLVLVAIPGIRTVFRHTDGQILNPVLGSTARLLLLYSVVFSLAWSIGA